MGKTRRRFSGLLLLACFLLVACSGPEAKKAKFLERGKEHSAKGDFVRAGLEFKNAIQIDPKFAEAYHQLGLSLLSRGDFRGAYGSLSKATDLDPKLLPAQIQLGKLLLIAGEREKAMEKAELVLKSAPDDVDAQLLKGAVLLVGKETAKACVYLEGLQAKGIDRPDLYLLLARAYMQEKDSRGAEAVLLQGLKRNPKVLPLRRALAERYAADGRYEAAAEQVREVIALEPANYGNSITLAALYWNTKQEPKGREVLDNLVAAKPLDEDRRLDTAKFYLSRGAVAEAVKLLQEGIRLDAKTFRLRFALADVYKSTGRSEQAVAVLNECLALDEDRKNPDILTTLTALAKTHLERREVDKARGYSDEVVKKDPKNVDAHLVRGNLNLLAGDGAGAVAEFRTVVGERPQFIQGYLRLAEGHLLKKEMNLAQEALQNALKADPNSRDARRALGRFHAMRKEYPKAEEDLRRILEENPSDLEVRADLGDVYVAAREPGKAEKEYEEIKRRAPKVPLGYVKMGDYYRAQGKRDRAAAEYTAAIKEAPGNMPLYIFLGRIYIEGKEYAKAEKTYAEALARRPDFWPAANDLAALLSEHPGTGKELDRALELAKSAYKLRPDDPVVQDTLGWVSYKKGDNAQALDLLAKAQGKMAGHPEINYHLGMALVKAGKKEQGKKHLGIAVAPKGEYPWKAEATRTLAGI
ncbi:tetratricopeptide repeat protein [Candidatus Deferrimicrobium sp.]|uniref:tetratricopeptide repeat protein n=1 Tax=Candidatus Deferrimicrobium sp. TaxID=3060586 RepID=UPI002ED10253